MLLFVELMAGAAAFTGVILNNTENKKSSKKEEDSEDLDASNLSYPEDE